MAYNNNEKKVVPTQVGEHGEHTVGGMIGAATGGLVGAAAVTAAASGAAAGAAMGTAAGPLGLAAGAVIGAVVGGLAGKGIAQQVDPTTEDAYWSNNYSTRPYVDKSVSYDQYQPAFHHGINAMSNAAYQGRSFDEIEPQLGSSWSSVRGDSKLDWDKARPAARDAYDRLYNRTDTDAI